MRTTAGESGGPAVSVDEPLRPDGDDSVRGSQKENREGQTESSSPHGPG